MAQFLVLYVFFFSFFCLRYWALANFTLWYFWRRDSAFTLKYCIQRANFSSDDMNRDLLNSFKSFFIGALPPTLAHSALVRPYTRIYDHPLDHSIGWLVLSYFLVYHCHDIFYYWAHRLMHQPWFFKRVHHWHHQTRNTSPFTGYSMSFVESISEYIWVFPLIFFMPLNSWMMDIFWIHLLVNNSLGHSGITFDHVSFYKIPGNQFLMKSQDHYSHHQKMNENFGASLKIWDHLMGTANKPALIHSDQ